MPVRRRGGRPGGARRTGPASSAIARTARPAGDALTNDAPPSPGCLPAMYNPGARRTADPTMTQVPHTPADDIEAAFAVSILLPPMYESIARYQDHSTYQHEETSRNAGRFL